MKRRAAKKEVISKRSEKVGLPPGSLVYVGEVKEKEPNIEIYDFNAELLEIKELKKITNNLRNEDPEIVRWININGLGGIEIVEKLGKQFDFHPLLLEDILNPNQRPKIEDYGEYEVVFLKLVFWNNIKEEIEQEQTVLILGKNYLISLQEDERNIFQPIRDRITKSYGRIRSSGPDYLMYALTDVIIDNYFILIEKIGEKVEHLEDEIEKEPDQETSQEIHELKKNTIAFRRLIWPLREVINKLQRGDLELILDSTQIYLRDLYDHIIQIIDHTETFRDLLSGLRENYLSRVSNRMNQIINVLTIISTIFIPLSFLAGLYGMNFAYMPELQNPYGYFILLIVMGSLAAAMLVFFRYKKWL